MRERNGKKKVAFYIYGYVGAEDSRGNCCKGKCERMQVQREEGRTQSAGASAGAGAEAIRAPANCAIGRQVS